jgi:hypothetical protein
VGGRPAGRAIARWEAHASLFISSLFLPLLSLLSFIISLSSFFSLFIVSSFILSLYCLFLHSLSCLFFPFFSLFIISFSFSSLHCLSFFFLFIVSFFLSCLFFPFSLFIGSFFSLSSLLRIMLETAHFSMLYYIHSMNVLCFIVYYKREKYEFIVYIA